MSKRLEAEVWSLDNCAGCGMCVAACSKQVLGWPEGGGTHPVREERIKTVGYTKVPLDSCTFCEKFCEEACPRLERWASLDTRVTLAALSVSMRAWRATSSSSLSATEAST